MHRLSIVILTYSEAYNPVVTYILCDYGILSGTDNLSKITTSLTTTDNLPFYIDQSVILLSGFSQIPKIEPPYLVLLQHGGFNSTLQTVPIQELEPWYPA